MNLAKNHIDIGLFTNNLEPMLAFWQGQVGLPFEQILPTGAGNRQHRHGLNGSVLKLNHTRDLLAPAPPSGYRELLIARQAIDAPRALVDPDGNRVTLVPPGHNGINGIGIRYGVRDVEAFRHFFGQALELKETAPATFLWGDTLLLVEQDSKAIRTEEMRAPGYRYITVQVRSVDLEHARFLERGAEEGRPPITLGTTARISFIRDPDGNWIEVSQRASLVGTVEPQEDVPR